MYNKKQMGNMVATEELVSSVKYRTVPKGMLGKNLKFAERYLKNKLGLGGISVFYEIRGRSPCDMITLALVPVTEENRRRLKSDPRYHRTVLCISDALHIPTIFFAVCEDCVYFSYRAPLSRKRTIHRATRESFWDFFFVEDFYSAERVELKKLPHETEDSENWYSVNHHRLPKDYYSIDVDCLHPHPTVEGKAMIFEIKREGEDLTYNQKVGLSILKEKADVEIHLIYLREE